MVDWYTTTKFVHVMLVVLGGGMSAGSGVWIEFTARGAHEAFVLRQVRRFHLRFVLPGLVLIPVTGVATAWVGSLPLTQGWIVVAAVLWAVVFVAILVFAWVVTANSGCLRTWTPRTVVHLVVSAYGFCWADYYRQQSDMCDHISNTRNVIVSQSGWNLTDPDEEPNSE